MIKIRVIDLKVLYLEDLTCDDTSYPNKYRSKCFKTCDDPYINKDDTCYRPESIKMIVK